MPPHRTAQHQHKQRKAKSWSAAKLPGETQAAQSGGNSKEATHPLSGTMHTFDEADCGDSWKTVSLRNNNTESRAIVKLG
jgi:hypothetical protein